MSLTKKNAVNLSCMVNPDRNCLADRCMGWHSYNDETGEGDCSHSIVATQLFFIGEAMLSPRRT